MFLNGYNVFYRSGFANDPFLREYGITGMAKEIQPSYAYPKCIKTDAKPTAVSDLNKTLNH